MLGESLAAQTGLDGVEPRLVVVDNDPAGSAREVADALAGSLGWPVTYEVEPDPGIPAVRRRIVALALAADADALVFVDDDEQAPPHWLATLVGHWRRSGADAVTGPVRRRLPADAPAWARSSDLFDPTGRHVTGTRMPKGYTGNALVSRAVLDRLDVPFDDAFRHTGSSDLHFFLRAVREGFVVEWCEEAVVEETIGGARLTWGWYVRRAYRSGAGDTVARRLLAPGPRTTLEVLARAVLRTGHGVVLLPVALARPALRSLAVRRVASGVGTLAGLLGHNYEEYRRADSV
ncbi:glycosyltransferase [Arthrobacter sp. NEB 688]|uniref:glycosyltransferase n=1 Tax=Arthrobacter sp. NEB 688 TaxID=904039 RepID=UPI002570E6B6|nr:glycosyltransferase [Arthrobacter sp. NEB 688]